MNKALILILFTLILGTTTIAEETSKPGAPFRLSEEKLAGKGLDSFAPWPKEMILSGTSVHTISELFSGELVVGVYESEPTKLAITSPWPFDELVVVLSGILHLTQSGAAETQAFPAGSYVIVPRGFTGTWDMQGDYREIYVIEKNAYAASQEPGGLLSE